MASPLREARRRSQDVRTQSRRNSSQSGIPMATSRNAANRLANTQPTYNFLTGATGDLPTPPQQTFRQSHTAKAEIGNEDLRAQINALRYEVESLKQAREVAKIQHEREIRDAQSKAEADFKRAQASESDKHVTTHKYDAVAKELKVLQDLSVNHQHGLEKKLRALQEENRSLKEDVEEAQSDLSSLDRQHKHQLQGVELKHTTLQQTLKDVQADLEHKSTALRLSQEHLTQRDAEVGVLEDEVLKLKTQSEALEDVATIKHELSEQVAYIRQLEKANREQVSELRHLRQVHKSVQIVEEEKRVLDNKVRQMDDLQRELCEAQFQREILENERRLWAAYLQDSTTNGEPEFDSPEAVVRALVRERMEKASLTDRLGAVQPEIAEKEQIIKSLESERSKLQTELEKLKSTGGGTDGRTKARLERQKALAVKEIEYLRDQLKTFESEDITGEIEIDPSGASRQRIQELETLVAQYRQEVQIANSELSNRETAPVEPGPPTLKRPHSDEADEHLGQLSRKIRKLQSELSTLQQTSSISQAELSATKTQLSSLQSSSRTRVLTLRSNPTDDFQNLKYSSIATLRSENRALMAQLEEAPHSTKVVPISSLDAARQEISDLEKQVADREKMNLRLKQIWSRKALEFREAVASILGWNMEFTPNGKFRMTSIFHAGSKDDGYGGTGNGIIFDGDKGEMKFAGGPDSEFAREVKALVRFWVAERGEIPAFMAACQLEFYEKSTRALRM